MSKSKAKEDSSYHNRMKEIFSKVYTDRTSLHRVLNFLEPEWQRRDTMFLSKLRFVAEATPDASRAYNVVEVARSLIDEEFNDEDLSLNLNRLVNTVNTSNGLSGGFLRFDEGLALILLLASMGLVSRDAPTTNDRGVPVFNLNFHNRASSILSMLRALKAGAPPTAPAVKEVGDMSVPDAKRFFTEVAAYEPAKPAPKVEEKITGLSDADVERIAVRVVALLATKTSKAVEEIESVRRVLRIKGLPDADPAATILAKLNKKKMPT